MCGEEKTERGLFSLFLNCVIYILELDEEEILKKDVGCVETRANVNPVHIVFQEVITNKQ